MIRKILIGCLTVVLLAVAGFFILGPVITERQQNVVEAYDLPALDPADQQFHDALFVADLHADTLLWKRDFMERGQRGQVDIPRLVEGNVALQVFSIVTKTPAGLNYDHNDAHARDNITLLAIGQLWPVRSWFSLTERALFQASRLTGAAEIHPDRLTVIRTAADLEGLLQRRRAGERIVGGLIATEGSHALEGELGNVDRLYDAGFRMMSLQHFFDNALGGSLHGSERAGLTPFGADVVQRIEEKSILLDVSHSSEQVVRDALAIATRPLIISHTGTFGHCSSARNVSDELMREVAAAGGLIGIGYWEAAVCDTTPAGIAGALRAAVDLVGEDHVALGSDFDGAVTTKIDASQLAHITAELRAQGMSDEVIAKIMGGNQRDFFLRYLPQQ